MGAHTGHVGLVVNTHWHSDHVGGNELLQAMGGGIAASTPDARALARRDAGGCLSEYLDQPVTIQASSLSGVTVTGADRRCRRRLRTTNRATTRRRRAR